MKVIRILIPIFSVILILFVIFLPPIAIEVHSISCETQFGECDEYLISKINKASNKSLKDTRALIKKTLASEVLVEDYSLQYNFPDRLKLSVILRKPEFAIKDLNGYFLIDREGVVISKVENTNLPYIEMPTENLKVTQKVSDTTLFALLTLNDVFYFYQTRIGKIEDNKLIIELEGAPRVIFPLEGDRKVLVGSLRLILSRLRGEGEEPRIETVHEIDLRFKNPVLR